MNLIDLCERGYIPDFLTRLGMRRLIAQRLRDERRRDTPAARAAWLAELRASPIAIDTGAANEQHYEVPPAFFEMHLGPHLKYSCCLYDDGGESLSGAEAAMLHRYAERAALGDGQRVLDLGCGWGSLSLWLARRYPRAQIVGLSNSHGQREFILRRAAELGLRNLQIVTGDIATFEFPDEVLGKGFDRVLSIEMFEHMRNYERLLAKIAGWLRADGRLFVHVFAHRELSYPFEERDASDWMTKHFFRGGLMPSRALLAEFQGDLRLERDWWLPGTHYARTAEDWLAQLDARRHDIHRLFAGTFGAAQAALMVQRWRMFYMAVAELFGHAGGGEWGVAHYLFAPRKAQA
ncbi:SAM-dependent methyltransferase [Solimonas soli]|uniref:SAM-dependent methyltransferase n=1 Tax=Solimonas soli TaxID=413479 RepID=UPI00048A416F|nr:class I SAM-dependent methyltransferase [Solimonas soli]